MPNQQVGCEPRHGGDDERVSQQLTTQVSLRMPGHRPHRRHIEQRHAHTDQHRNQLQALGACQLVRQRQCDEGIEAKRNLRARGMLARVDAFAQPRQVRQAVGHRDAAQPKQQTGADQARGGAQVQRAFDDGMEQQHREKEKIHQTFNLRPDRAVEGGVPADEVAADDEREVGKEELRVVHRGRITLKIRGDPGLPLCVIHNCSARFLHVISSLLFI